MCLHFHKKSVQLSSAVFVLVPLVSRMFGV